MHDCIRSLIYYKFNCISLLILANFIGIIIFGEFPISSGQLIWILIIYDTLAQLAVLHSIPQDDILEKSYYTLKSPLLSSDQKENIFLLSFF